jgi:hypothetical protein
MSATMFVLVFLGLLIAVAVYAVNIEMYPERKRDAHQVVNH